MSEKRSAVLNGRRTSPRPRSSWSSCPQVFRSCVRRRHRRIVWLEHVAEPSRPFEFEAAVVQIVVARHGVEDLEDCRLAVAVDGVPRSPAQVGLLLEAGRDASAAAVAGQTVGR